MTEAHEANEEFEPGEHLDPDERDPEAPVEDAVEQAAEVESAGRGTTGPAETEDEVQRGLEVNEYDAVEQAHVVQPEEDY
jgi:hypothetical protein